MIRQTCVARCKWSFRFAERISRCLLLLFFLLASLPSSVLASSIDYAGLEALFGEPVTLSGSGKPQRLSSVPLSMSIITAKDIEKSGASDIPQLLRRVPGVDVTRNFLGSADVNIRGFNQPFSNRLLVLIDGRQVYMDSFGMTIWHAFPIQLEEIQQIEIIRGPNTALFGFNAASGVVNIVTKNAETQKINQISARVGTQSHREAHLITTTTLAESWDIRASLGGHFSDGYDRVADLSATDERDAVQKANFNITAERDVTPTSHLGFDVGFNQQNTHASMPYYLAADFRSISRHVSAHYSHEADASSLWHLHYYHNAVDAYIDTGQFLGVGRLPGSHNSLHVLKLSNLRPISAEQNLRLAVEARQNSLTPDDPGGGDGKFTMNIFSANLMWDWSITPSIFWTNSVNFSHWQTDRHQGELLTNTQLPIAAEDYDKSEDEIGLNLGLLYKANPLTNIKFTVSQGVRVPSLLELSRLQSSNIADLYGNPNLDSETLLSADLGFKRKWGNDLKNSFEGDIFYVAMDDVISSIVYSPFIHGVMSNKAEITFDNVGASDAYGLELALRGAGYGGDVNWGANYTYLRHKDQIITGPVNFIDFAQTHPKHKVNLHLDIRSNAWVWDFNLHWVDARPNYQATTLDIVSIRREARVDSYVLFHVGVSYWFSPKTRLGLEGVNLLDEHVERPSFEVIQGAGGSNQLDQAFYLHLEHNF